MKRKFARAIPLALAGVALALAASPEKDRKSAETGLIGENLVSGPALYRKYCAACHGLDGTGNGPAAKALKDPVPDLTTISRRNGGRFPESRIVHIIDGYEAIAAHGDREMPIWGDLLPQRRYDTLLKLREHNLTEFIRSLQK